MNNEFDEVLEAIVRGGSTKEAILAGLRLAFKKGFCADEEDRQEAWTAGYTDGQADEAEDAVRAIEKLRMELGGELDRCREALAQIAKFSPEMAATHAAAIARKVLSDGRQP